MMKNSVAGNKPDGGGKRLLVLALIVVFAAGCTSAFPVRPDSGAIVAAVRPGDEVSIATRDGRVRRFMVREVSDRQILGEEETIQIADIVQIDRLEFNRAKTVGLTAAIAGSAVVLAAVVWFIQMMATFNNTP